MIGFVSVCRKLDELGLYGSQKFCHVLICKILENQIACKGAFEDRLLAAGVYERIRRNLLGHALKRERYGARASLEHMKAILAKVAL